MEKVKLTKSNRGITLIALIITIIVMLILAGVAINMVIGDNGIFRKSDEGAKIYKNAANNEASSLNGIDKEMGDLIDQYHNENTNYTMVEGVPVPKGFTHTEGTKETGFVIKNNTDGNEFVWIPVEENSGYTYERYAFAREGWEFSQIITETDSATNTHLIQYEKQVEEEASNTRFASLKNTRIANIRYLGFVEIMPRDEQNSVKQYKGYYIARYEAGFADVTEENIGNYSEFMESLTKETTVEEIESNMGKPVSQKGKIPYIGMRKEQAEGLAERLYNPSANHVTSKLCSGFAWDTALKFIETKNPGWATNSEGERYQMPENNIVETGYHSVNNIYDMGGNLSEWTTENSIWEQYDVVRGGDASDGATALLCPAAMRAEVIENNEISGMGATFRITLFL